jgi:cyclopropane-fatty-acyl-phospholipid synthase
MSRIGVDAAARRIVGGLLAHLDGGTLELTDRWGTETFAARRSGSENEPMHAVVRVHDSRLYARVLREGSVGLGEAYADGWWDADDVTTFLRLAHRSLSRTHEVRDRARQIIRPVIDPIARLRRADRQRDRKNIRAHYDLGNELFQHLLDESMMYSCAVFESPNDSLEVASHAKLDRLARILALSPGDRVLEIGTGWGGFAIHAASTYGCHVTTTTISHEQYEFARARVRAAGLEHLVTVREDDYRDVDESFDKLVAIEMIEAVDWREYDAFFAKCRSLLTDDGLLALQAIVVPDASFDRTKHTTDFIKAAIFPGGCLPSVGALTAAATGAGGGADLSLVHLDDIGPHYAETLRRWRANLAAARPELAGAGFNERFARLWDFYFSYCEAGFDERYVSVVQLAYAAPGRMLAMPASTDRPTRHLSMA